VRVLGAGICNTDVELARGYYPYTGVLGHEFVGVVERGAAELQGQRVVGEINYQPFDHDGRIVDRPELRALMRRVLSVGGDRLQALSRRADRSVVAIAGGRAKLEAVRGALAGRFMNILITDEDGAARLLRTTP